MEQQPGIDKKAVIAILLCAVVWAVWMNTSYRRNQQQIAARRAAEKAGAAATVATGGTIAMTATPGPGDFAGTTSEPSATPAYVPATIVTLENKVLELALSSAGARPVKADLRAFHESVAAGGEDLAPELIQPRIEGAEDVASLAPWFGDAEGSRIPADAPFAVLSSSSDVVVFRRRGPDGLMLTRTYRTRGDGYSLELVEEYRNEGSRTITGRPGVVWAINDKKGKAGSRDPFTPGAAVADRFQYKGAKKPDEPREWSGTVEFVAIHDRYFAAAAAPVEPAFKGTDSVRFGRPSKSAISALALDEPITLEPGRAHTIRYELYLGPKDYNILRNLGHHLGWVMNWGQGQGVFWAFIGWITRGLWHALGWFHGIAGNWGIAIILLTLVMRGLLWPLAARQMRMANEFSAKSQKIKPQIDKLREKYAADPMEMNRQTMALYKQHGISPFSPLAGCLPLLLQLPIWWALYRVLWTSIDLRGQPFYLWIRDLSAPDPWYILPVLLGAVTWLQMKITPQPGTDPAQQRMMQWLMPIMFTFFMWSLPAGLVVYIFTSTLMGIAQQFLLKRAMGLSTSVPKQREAT